MLTRTDEDRIKSRIAEELKSVEDKIELSEYIRRFNQQYELEKYHPPRNHYIQKGAHRLFHGESLDKKLMRLANEWNQADEIHKRRIDLRAYKTIKRCKDCRNNHKLTRFYYFDFYGQIKDYFSEVFYIDYREEKSIDEQESNDVILPHKQP